ncbi:hypothetical protein WJX72_011716 [[Myrmecia] bisecta]|uniref:Ecdysoneless n=1 Tax=[Myrmecia] bisecta TaxID=41462 RepID=A0AAW1QH23_9CHLO
MATARSLGRAGGDVENVMYYEVYPAQGLQADELEIMRRQLLESVLPHMHGHIWQRDCFNLRSSFVKRPPWQQQAAGKGAQPACLWGSVCFGDNLEDEWFVTWLLLELTRRQAGTVVRAWDSDGDYLLIEAAYSLPKWLKPETSHNRVWLHNGKVHVVLLPSASNPSLPPAPTVEQALQIVRAEGVSTEASAGVQRAITDRLAGYPAKAAAEMHTARCVLPARLAHVLSREQQLVAPAVEAFHYRDVDDMKAAARLAHFPAEDMVSTLVTFNRCLYAQLAQQQFEAPRGFPLPLPSHPAFRAAELGMKLTCGFEMMYCNRARFGAEQYQQTEVYQQSTVALAAPARRLEELLKEPINPEALQQAGAGAEDDDSWMRSGAAELEAELQQRQQEMQGDLDRHAARSAGQPAADSSFDPANLASQLQEFVATMSSYEGAELPDSGREQGLPGPASNLAGLLGLRLPENADTA